MDLHTILHLLRNPSGYGDELVRAARHAAADMLEAAHKPAPVAAPVVLPPPDPLGDNEASDCD